MSVLDTRSLLLERVGVVVAIWILSLETLGVLLPYVAAYLQLEMDEPTRSTIAQTQTTIQTVFIALASFFFGASVGGRQKDDTANKMATASVLQASTAAPAPVVSAVVPGVVTPPPPPHAATDAPQDVTLKPGDAVTVAAEAKPGE